MSPNEPDLTADPTAPGSEPPFGASEATPANANGGRGEARPDGGILPQGTAVRPTPPAPSGGNTGPSVSPGTTGSASGHAATGSTTVGRTVPHPRLDELKREIGRVIVGNDGVVEQVLIALFAGGHVLLEGVPGLGKTLLVRTLSRVLGLDFRRIQFTPDLMPADIVGTNVIHMGADGQRDFVFQPGPLFSNLVLADEINRATAKTQSALLEAMAEGTITAGGQTYHLDQPFFVLATQNPIEMEGTYPLPEAQVDRFMFKILLEMPSKSMLVSILERTTGNDDAQVRSVLAGAEIVELQRHVRDIPIATHLRDAIATLIASTHPRGQNPHPLVKRYVAYGASPRGLQAVALAAKSLAFLRGRHHVSFEEIRQIAPAALRHRLILNFEGEAEGVATDELIGKLVAQVESSVSLGGK